MGEKYAPEMGDKVRVVMEGEVTWVSTNPNKQFTLERSNSIFPEMDHTVSVEKLEPVTFKPGQLVRSKDSGMVFALGLKGYLAVGGSGFNPWDYDEDDFNSEHYELVELK